MFSRDHDHVSRVGCPLVDSVYDKANTYAATSVSPMYADLKDAPTVFRSLWRNVPEADTPT
eukprot:m.1548279 g.1548279  ORF g.1548279 m.1548279 type:complete len:61 (-) comp25263_c0_seq18:2160-2342(-)